MLRLLHASFIASLACPSLTIFLLFMTNAGWLKAEVGIPILFFLMPITAIACMIISILSLRRYKPIDESDSQVNQDIVKIRKKATAVLLQSIFFLTLLIVFMFLFMRAVNNFSFLFSDKLPNFVV